MTKSISFSNTLKFEVRLLHSQRRCAAEWEHQASLRERCWPHLKEAHAYTHTHGKRAYDRGTCSIQSRAARVLYWLRVGSLAILWPRDLLSIAELWGRWTQPRPCCRFRMMLRCGATQRRVYGLLYSSLAKLSRCSAGLREWWHGTADATYSEMKKHTRSWICSKSYRRSFIWSYNLIRMYVYVYVLGAEQAFDIWFVPRYKQNGFFLDCF